MPTTVGLEALVSTCKITTVRNESRNALCKRPLLSTSPSERQERNTSSTTDSPNKTYDIGRNQKWGGIATENASNKAAKMRAPAKMQLLKPAQTQHVLQQMHDRVP